LFDLAAWSIREYVKRGIMSHSSENPTYICLEWYKGNTILSAFAVRIYRFIPPTVPWQTKEDSWKAIDDESEMEDPVIK